MCLVILENSLIGLVESGSYGLFDGYFRGEIKVIVLKTMELWLAEVFVGAMFLVLAGVWHACIPFISY
jgi:hypothetical protein